MAIDPLSIGLLAGGSVASGLGSIFGARSQNQAVRTQTQGIRNNNVYAENLQTLPLYGPEYSALMDLVSRASKQAVDHGDTSGFASIGSSPEYAAFNKITGGPILPQVRNIAQQGIKQQGSNLRQFDSATSRLGGQQNDWLKSLDSLAAGGEDMARDFGRLREGVIRRDAGHTLNSADDVARAELAASGLSNSSAGADRLAGNRRMVNEDTQRQLSDVADARTRMLMGARGDRLSTMRSAGGDVLNRSYQRESDRQGILERNLTRAVQLRSMPIDLMRDTSRGIASSWSQMPVPAGGGASGIGSALSSIGGAAAGFGSYMMGQQMQNDSMTKQLAMLQALRSQ